jgi:hypothetical protein
MVMIEAPDEVNTLLLQFITEDSTLPTTANTPALSATPQRTTTNTPHHRPSTPGRPSTPEWQSPTRSASRMSTKSYKTLPIGHFT